MMILKMLVSFPVVALMLFFSVSPSDLTAQRPPTPQELKRQMQLRSLAQPEEVLLERTPVGPAPQLIGTTAKRIDRGRVDVRVYRDGQPVELPPRFHELITTTPANHHMELGKAVGKGVTLVPSEKGQGRWDLYMGVGGVDELCLAGNILVVKQVLVSSRKSPIEVRVDGETHRLRPGQALLVI
jgi:hypothetical protein